MTENDKSNDLKEILKVYKSCDLNYYASKTQFEKYVRQLSTEVKNVLSNNLIAGNRYLRIEMKSLLDKIYGLSEDIKYAPRCPFCGNLMIRRKGRKDENTVHCMKCKWEVRLE